MELRPYAVGDDVPILGLFERCFGKPMSSAFWRWRFLDNPTGSPMIELAWDGDVLAGHYAVSPVMLSIDGEPRLSALSMTTMTHPDYRGRGLFVELASSLYARLTRDGYAVVWGFPNSQSHRGFVRDLAWADVHEIPSLQLDRRRWSSPLAEPAPRIEAGDSVLDAIWQRCARQHRLGVVRDSGYLAWRYHRHPTNAYRILALETGYIVHKRYGQAVDLVDLVVVDDDPATLRTLIGSVLADAPDAGALNLWHPLRSPLHLELERLGFEPGSPTTYLGALALDRGVPDVGDVRNWRYAMGDSDVF